jgi:hypothetical protein
LATAINFERPVHVFSKWGEIWGTTEYGIRPTTQLNAVDSDSGVVSDPVSNWRFATNINDVPANLIEVWPLPASATTLRFVGQRTLKSIVAAADTVDIDDLLIAMRVAAKILQHRKMANAGIEGQLAQQRLLRLRASYPSIDAEVIFGGGSRQYNKDEGRLWVSTGGSSGTGDSMVLSGQFALTADSLGDSVAIAPAFTPVSVALTVASPVDGANIFATLVMDSLTSVGFSFTLSASPATAGYVLYYTVS